MLHIVQNRDVKGHFVIVLGVMRSKCFFNRQKQYYIVHVCGWIKQWFIVQIVWSIVGNFQCQKTE